MAGGGAASFARRPCARHWKMTTFVDALRLRGMTATMVLDRAMSCQGAAFLSPFSLDLNPIELAIFKLEAFLRLTASQTIDNDQSADRNHVMRPGEVLCDGRPVTRKFELSMLGDQSRPVAKLGQSELHCWTFRNRSWFMVPGRTQPVFHLPPRG